MPLPFALDRIESWQTARRRAGRMLVALDFDGTLAPIVEDPGRAALPPATRAALERLAARPDTDVAIISGRALEDLRARVGLEEIYYGGNHGLEIEGPGVQRVHEGAAASRRRIAACAELLRKRLSSIEGVEIEDKGLTLSVHYRRVARREEAERVRVVARAACEGREGVKVTEGKVVVEVRPDVDWDKGRATRFILAALEAGAGTGVVAIFIGDDRTDEDAFRALRGRGDGVVVAPAPPPDTAATAWARSTEEVVAVLEALAEPG